MFEVEDLVSATVVSRMRGDASAVVFDVYKRRPDARRHPQSRPERSGIPIGLYPYTALAVHYKWIDRLVDPEDLFGQGQQMRSLQLTGFVDRHTSADDRAAPAGHAGGQQLPVQAFQIVRLGHRHQPVASIPAEFTFDASLFVAAGRGAVFALETPM